MSEHEPRLLYQIANVTVSNITNGQETILPASGPLSLLLVPTTSHYNESTEKPEEDFYLHAHLPPALDLPLPATTQIFHQPPNSYLIPRIDLDLDFQAGGTFTRITFPSNANRDDVDTFETILAQCTSFLERESPPPMYPKGSHNEKGGYTSEKSSGIGTFAPGGSSGAEFGQQYFEPPPNPDSKDHQGYYGSEKENHGHLVLVDEENGSVVGELSEGYHVVEDPATVRKGSKAPVLIDLPDHPGGDLMVSSPEYLRTAMHPAYANSSLVSNAASLSRMIVTGASHLSAAMTSGADNFSQKSKPVQVPLTFKPTTHERARKLHNFTHGAAGFSSTTLGKVQHYAQNIGASVAGKTKERGAKDVPSKPGILNKSMIAFSTIADGVDFASKSLLYSGSAAATQIIGHRYGDEARQIAGNVTMSFKNVGLVYVDASGVSRRAIVKSVAKGMVVGRVRNGGEVIMSHPEDGRAQIVMKDNSGATDKTGMAGSGRSSPAGTHLEKR